MWNFQSLTHQLGDAFEKVRKEVESLGQYEEGGDVSRATQRSTDGIAVAEAPPPVSAEVCVAFEDVLEGSFAFSLHSEDQRGVKDEPRHQEKPREMPQFDERVPEGALEEGGEKEEWRESEQTHKVTVQLLPLKDSDREGDDINGVSHVKLELLFQSGEHSSDKTEDEKCSYREESVEEDVEMLKNLLSVREQQLQAQSQKLLQLQEQNESLERSALSVSQAEHDAMRHQYEERLRNVENRTLAIVKERDALKRNSAADSNKDAIIQEKEEIIEEVMAEGQRLSMKQLDLENAIRKKSARVKELETESESLKEKLLAEMSKSEQLSLEKKQLVQTLQETEAHQKEQLEVQRIQFENLLKEASAAQANADQAAKEVAKEGLLKRVQEAEERAQTLTSHIASLNDEMEAQRRQAEAVEKSTKEEMQLLERRCHEAEAKHEELLAKFPEATRPLLHQLEALQEDMQSKSETWALAERSLLEQLETAEESIQTARFAEQTALHKLKELNERYLRLEAKYQECRREVTEVLQVKGELEAEVEAAQKAAKEMEALVQKQAQEAENVRFSQQQVLEKLQGELSVEHAAKLSAEMEVRQMKMEYQKQKADLEHFSKSQSTAANAKLNKTVDEISVLSEATDREMDIESSRSVINARHRQTEQLQKQIQSLEKTRDHLSTELVSVTQRAQKAESSLVDFQKVKKELEDLQSRYASAIELLGEREEQVEEVKADLEDFKQMYREQIAYVAEQLSGSKS